MSKVQSRPARRPPAPEAVDENARNTMRANRGRDTGPELTLRRGLWRAGLRGYRINVAGLAGRPDVAFTRHKVAIFVNGCFWHRCPHCDPPVPKRHRAFWTRKFKENEARDARQQTALETAGWKVLVLWECQLKASIDQCVLRVVRAVAEVADESVDLHLNVAERPKRGYGR